MKNPHKMLVNFKLTCLSIAHIERENQDEENLRF